VPSDKQACLCQTGVISPLFYHIHVQSAITNRLILSVYRNRQDEQIDVRRQPMTTNRRLTLHIAVQSFIYQDDLAYQPDGRPAVDARASQGLRHSRQEPRPCAGWKNPDSTVQCSFKPMRVIYTESFRFKYIEPGHVGLCAYKFNKWLCYCRGTARGTCE